MWRVAMLVLLGLGAAMAHTFMFNRSRRKGGASTLSPMAQRKSSDVHAQIGGNETVLVKWCSSHYYTVLFF